MTNTISKKYIIGIIGTLLVLSIGIIGIFAFNQNTQNQESKLTIVTTLFPYYDILREITPQNVNVILIGNGVVDPHSFDPSPSDLVAISQADIIVMNGVVDEYIEDIIQSENIPANKIFEAIDVLDPKDIITHSKESKDTTKDHTKESAHHDESHTEKKDSHKDEHTHDEGKSHATDESKHSETTEMTEPPKDQDHNDDKKDEQVAHNDKKHKDEHGHEHGHDHGGIDPHVWMSPRLMVTIRQELLSFLENKNIPLVENQKNTNSLSQLQELYTSALAVCELPKGIATHAAFDYLVRDHSLELYSLSDISGEDNTTQTAFVDTIGTIREYNIEYILTDSNANDAFIETLKSDVNIQTLSLQSMETVDNFQEQSYTAIMESNVASLQQAFKCQ